MYLKNWKVHNVDFKTGVLKAVFSPVRSSVSSSNSKVVHNSIPRKNEHQHFNIRDGPHIVFFFTLMVLLGGPAEESKHDQRSGGSGRCCLENSSWLELHQIEYVLAGWPNRGSGRLPAAVVSLLLYAPHGAEVEKGRSGTPKIWSRLQTPRRFRPNGRCAAVRVLPIYCCCMMGWAKSKTWQILNIMGIEWDPV